MKFCLDQPVGAPPLSECVFPGDRVVIVPDKRIAREEELLAELASQIFRLCTEPEEIAIVLTEEEDKKKGTALRNALRERLPGTDGEPVRIAVHSPAERKTLRFLAANDKGEPVGLCRTILDADLVIPVGEIPSKPYVGYYGVYTALFPRFCDEETQIRFLRAEQGNPDAKLKKRLLGEVEEMAAFLGILLTIQRSGSAWSCGLPATFGVSVRSSGRRSADSPR